MASACLAALGEGRGRRQLGCECVCVWMVGMVMGARMGLHVRTRGDGGWVYVCTGNTAQVYSSTIAALF